MARRGSIKLNIQRGAGIVEFGNFLSDLQGAYLALYLLPSNKRARHIRRHLPILIGDYEREFLVNYWGSWAELDGEEIYPADQLEITRIIIQSPGWIEVLGSLNPLQQIREYLKDRHERMKDLAWRSDAEKERALLENDILRAQAERERTSAISDFNDLLKRMDVDPDQRERILWDRLGPPMMRLARHQDTGLLGSQNDNVDHQRE